MADQITLRDIIREAGAKATREQRDEALQAATRYLDGLPFVGERLSAVQSGAWPRSGVTGPDGQPVTAAPPQIMQATYIVAGLLLARVPYTPEAADLVGAVLHGLLQPGAKIFDGRISAD